jgi:cyclohexanecarboxylate-CoA ligase
MTAQITSLSAGTDRDGRAGTEPWRSRTILDDLSLWAERTPGRLALACWHADGRPKDTVTYAQLAAIVDRLAAGLLRLGVRRGDVVTLQLLNSWQLVALILACARIGAVAGPVAPVMRRREVEFMTRLTRSPLYVGHDTVNGFSFDAMSAEVAVAVPTLRHRVLLNASGQATTPALDFSLPGSGSGSSGAPAELDGLQAQPHEVAQVMFTSGTTGEPKGVMHSHATLYAINHRQGEVLRLHGDEVTAMGSPTTLQAGYTWNFIMPLQLGATAVQVDAWNPDLMLDIMAAERVTFFYGPPPFLTDLIRAQRQSPRDLTALRTFATGSAPIPPVLVEDALSVLGCRVYALWGMTENGCVTVTRPEDPVMRAAESDGTPVPGMQVRIVSAGTGRPVPGGQTGLLQVRGDNQCLGYFRRPGLYQSSLTGDGWFDTGDLARDDGHGGIRIAGRIKDVISRGGLKVPVVEVEAALLRHPAVRDVAVVGYPDDRLGERACAFIVAEDADGGPGGAASKPPTLADLRTHLTDLGMAKPYWPERLELTAELPKTPSGKVQKYLLRQRLTDPQAG